jgi:hypothetical protein
MQAKRKHMHGPLWVAEDETYLVQLWGPNHRREFWTIGWSLYEDGETIDQGYEEVSSYIDALAIPDVPLEAVAALLKLVRNYDPDEECDHTQAFSFTILVDGQVCGHCGRVMEEQ